MSSRLGEIRLGVTNLSGEGYVAPPDEWIPPGQAKPPKPDPGGKPGGGGNHRETQKEIREYRWRYIRSDAQGRYVAESATFDVFEQPGIPENTGSGGVSAESSIAGIGILGFVGAAGVTATGQLSGEGTVEGEAPAVTSPEEAPGIPRGGPISRRRGRVIRFPGLVTPSYIPSPERPEIRCKGSVTSGASTAGVCVLEFTAAGGVRARSYGSGRGSEEFIGTSKVIAINSLGGRSSVDNTIPEEDEELILLLTA